LLSNGVPTLGDFDYAAGVRRRGFLRGAAALGASGVWGCAVDASPAVDGGGVSCAGADASLEIERVPFEGEAGSFDVSEGTGLDGRLYTDLSRLDAEHLITDNDAFYVRTRYPDGLDPGAPWSLLLGGLVEQPLSLSLPEVLELERDQGVHLLECSGNFRARGFGLMSAASFHGVPVLDLLDRVRPTSAAARVLITGSDAHSRASNGSLTGASWIVSPAQLLGTGAFLATRMNGAALPLDHGYPLRLVNPGWYGCSCIKWVQSIEWVTDDAASTSQMVEFSSRTHQVGEPALARDYAAPEIQYAAMPIRVEKRRGGSGVCYRIVGLLWGGSEPVTALGVSFDAGQRFQRITLAAPATTQRTWSLWQLDWAPPGPGRYELVCRVEAPAPALMRRLDSKYYARSILIDEI
jgi:DMSO/TMAO reductase YedYZ molybdopterin-dependent catalytic subunit